MLCSAGLVPVGLPTSSLHSTGRVSLDLVSAPSCPGTVRVRMNLSALLLVRVAVW